MLVKWLSADRFLKYVQALGPVKTLESPSPESAAAGSPSLPRWTHPPQAGQDYPGVASPLVAGQQA